MERRAASESLSSKATKRVVALLTLSVLLLSMFASTLIERASADVRVNSLAKLGFGDQQLERQPSLKNRNGGGKNVLRADAEVFPYQVPSNFGYAKLAAREKNNNDRSLRDNIDNEANQRNVANEQPKDMLPCRQDEGRPRQAMKVSPGDRVDMPLQFNNPHNGEAEINIWKNVASNDTKVSTIARFDSGGGFSQNRPSYTIPENTPECKAEDKCLIQYYWHSVEPRTYAICSDVEIAPKAAGGAGGADGAPAANDKNSAEQNKDGTDGGKRKLRYDKGNNNTLENQGHYADSTGGNVNQSEIGGDNGNKDAGGGAGGNDDLNKGSSLKEFPIEWKDPVYYSDSFYTAHIDSTHSGYQGQDAKNIGPELQSRLYLHDSTTTGGLNKDALPKQTLAARKAANKQVRAAVKAEERKSIAANKSKQRQLLKQSAAKGYAAVAQGGAAPKGELPGFESDRYSDVLNPNRRRKYTNTYVTNVNYKAIEDNLRPEFEQKGLTRQTPAVKDSYKYQEVYGLKNNNLKNKENAAALPENFKKSLGETSQKLLKARSFGNDEEAELAEDIAKHKDAEKSFNLRLREFKEPEPQNSGDPPTGDSFALTDDEKNLLSSAIADDGGGGAVDLSEGDSAIDQKNDDTSNDPGDNPDDQDTVDGEEE